MTSSKDDSEERKARATRLREEIARLKSHSGRDATPPRDPSSESPRDFVERRMRELDDKENVKKS
jgi:hypothetical protein